MRLALLLGAGLAVGSAAQAQLTLLPQLGIETSKTDVTVNGQNTFAPLGGKVSPQGALRLAYAFKKGHGPFVDLATSRSIVNYSFSDPQALAYTALRGNTQLRLEGGYQVSSKPLYFKKATAAASRSSSSAYQNQSHTGCSGSFAHSGCCHKSTNTATKPDTRSWMQIQPSLGVAYVPGTPQAAVYKNEQGAYAYNAGNWTTAAVAGINFVFGTGKQSKYVLSVNYLKGLGNLDTRTFTSVVDNKPITTTLKSAASSWNVRLGLPITFKKQTTAKQPVQRTYNTEHRCGQYRWHCTRTT